MNRRLYRSRRDSVLGGVCGGVADYLDIDPSIVRIIWAVLALVTGGLFLVLYIVMWIVVPEGPSAATAAHAGAEGASGAGAPPGEQPESTPTEASAPAWEGHEERLRRGGSGGAVIFGLILIGAGVWFLVDEYIPTFDPDLVWPIALVAVGAALLFVSLRRRT